ncbi:hypothetical protein D3C84_1157230 [compost metagenome]
MIGVLLENEISGMNEPGDLLIVKKGLPICGKEQLVYNKDSKKLFMTTECCVDSDAVRVVGEVIEERFNG